MSFHQQPSGPPIPDFHHRAPAAEREREDYDTSHIVHNRPPDLAYNTVFPDPSRHVDLHIPAHDIPPPTVNISRHHANEHPPAGTHISSRRRRDTFRSRDPPVIPPSPAIHISPPREQPSWYPSPNFSSRHNRDAANVDDHAPSAAYVASPYAPPRPATPFVETSRHHRVTTVIENPGLPVAHIAAPYQNNPHPTTPISRRPHAFSDTDHPTRNHEVPASNIVYDHETPWSHITPGSGPFHHVHQPSPSAGPDIHRDAYINFPHVNVQPDYINHTFDAGYYQSFNVPFTVAYAFTGQVYQTGLLLLPSLYFFRIDQLLKDTDLTTEEIAYMAARTTARQQSTRENKENRSPKSKTRSATKPEVSEDPDPPKLAASYRRLKREWCTMIDEFVEEWRTLNIVSAVLVPGILTLFQIDSAANDPVTRSLAFWSLILALWSLVYGCLYVIQFRRMRSESIMIEWAFEAEKRDGVFWNTWVMLALPAASLAWSVLVFLIAIIWFMWRSRANPPPDIAFPASSSTELGFRIFTCGLFAVAVVYFALVLRRFFQFGAPMTSRWKRHMADIIADVARLSA